MEMLLKLNRHPSANSCIGKLVNSRGNRAARRYHI